MSLTIKKKFINPYQEKPLIINKLFINPFKVTKKFSTFF
jgi:hypothetical protein